MKGQLQELCSSVSALNQEAMRQAKSRLDSLAKPPGSLGKLETLAIQLAGITGRVCSAVEQKELLVFAADNGVVAEGVSSAPQSVTFRQTFNLTRGKTGAAVLAKKFGCTVTVCDVGINTTIKDEKIVDRKIAYGTKNIVCRPAMTEEETLRAMLIGADLAKSSCADVIGIGEMGIGNTTTASAVLSVLLNIDAERVTGRGGGLTDEAFQKKKEVIRRAVSLHHPNRNDVTDVLQKVGGLDIAAMCGAFLGSAASDRPVVIDGFISAVAALCAVKLCPEAKQYLIPGHESCEPGYRLAVQELGLHPMLSLDMRLGEGSGCPLIFQILDAASAIINDMATFSQAEIDDSYLNPIREKRQWEEGDSIWES